MGLRPLCSICDVTSGITFCLIYRYIGLQTFSIGIKHGFSCINVCQVPGEMLKTEAEGRDFHQLLRDLANANALKNNV